MTRKLRFYPNKEQKKLFNKCFSTHRFFYNKAVHEINQRYSNRIKEFTESKTCVLCSEPKDGESFTCQKHKNSQLPWKLNISLASIRPMVMTSDREAKGTTMEWQTDVPYDTRQLAIKDAVEAYKSAIALKKKGYIDHFSLGYKSRKMPKKTFWVDKRALTGKWNIFPTRLGSKGNLRFRKSTRVKLPKTLPLDCNFKILYDRGAYYIVLTLQKEKKKTEQKEGIIALDPGVRSFMTGYSPDQGTVCKIGEDKIATLKKLHNRIDLLRSVRSKVQKKRTKKNIKKRLLKLEKQGTDLVNDLHNQVASWLSKTYSQILLPTFGTSKMLSGGDLPSGVNRRMQGLAFYRFQEKLKGLCGHKVYLVGEEYTTKTCGCCGKINNEVGSSIIFRCPSCGMESDRDFHAARNILIKTITQYGDDAHRLNFSPIRAN